MMKIGGLQIKPILRQRKEEHGIIRRIQHRRQRRRIRHHQRIRMQHHRLSEEHKSRNDSRRRCCNTGKSNGGEMEWPRFVC
ncbi:unnamed protein product [Sphagnum troendelagicum]|uniref:Uncharacterized protein n=1 Tax=Sphagnum troendelagicum TaxID=128251 RepID=A0ABP0UZU7_9BRYO